MKRIVLSYIRTVGLQGEGAEYPGPIAPSLPRLLLDVVYSTYT